MFFDCCMKNSSSKSSGKNNRANNQNLAEFLKTKRTDGKTDGNWETTYNSRKKKKTFKGERQKVTEGEPSSFGSAALEKNEKEIKEERERQNEREKNEKRRREDEKDKRMFEEYLQ